MKKSHIAVISALLLVTAGGISLTDDAASFLKLCGKGAAEDLLVPPV